VSDSASQLGNQRESRESRESRYTSHALVELRRFRRLPIGVHSAVLLDISLGGFKVELTGEQSFEPGKQFWLSVPLLPLGIQAPTRLICRGEARWFDAKRYRVGGIFLGLTDSERGVIDQVIETLKGRGVLVR
jgi:hypothetical protein